MKRIVTFLALAALMGGPAFGAARDVHEGLVMIDAPIETVYEVQASTVTTSGDCLNLSGVAAKTVTSGACDNLGANQAVVARPMLVKNMRVVILDDGDSGYICVFTIEVGAAAVGNTLTTTATAAEGSITNQAQNVIITEGALLGIMVADGGAACVGTDDPAVNVQLEGWYLN